MKGANPLTDCPMCGPMMADAVRAEERARIRRIVGEVQVYREGVLCVDVDELLAAIHGGNDA